MPSKVQNIEKIYKAGLKACFVILGVIMIASCSSSVRFSSDKDRSNPHISNNSKSDNSQIIQLGSVLTGKASYYGDEFHGRKTANGELYDRTKLSAAHKSLPFGTNVRVRNLRNNKEVIVRINDRGPFVAGRIIDLSFTAAKEIDMIRDGVIEVEITVLSYE